METFTDRLVDIGAILWIGLAVTTAGYISSIDVMGEMRIFTGAATVLGAIVWAVFIKDVFVSWRHETLQGVR
jgi:hypothetical protein